jgi:dTDP-glucose 4,6-dehydratase
MTSAIALVTGGAGFIGSHFVQHLVGRGHRVLVLDKLTYAGHRENLEEATGPGSFELVQGDIADSALVASLFARHPIQWVVNLAAESHVDRSISGPQPFISTNIVGVFNLLQHSLNHFQGLPPAERGKFRFLQVSTDEVYGELGETGKFSESTPIRPNSPYSASKASGDLLVRAWHQTYGLPTVTTNCSNNYGPKQFPEKFIPFMIRCAREDRPLGVYGKGLNVRDWIHVQDHCAGLQLALELGRPGETYCFGGDSERSNVQVANSICDILDQLSPRRDGKSYKAQIAFVADRPGHDFRYAIDDGKARRELGFKRQHDFDSGLRATVRWYLDHPSWVQKVLDRERT